MGLCVCVCVSHNDEIIKNIKLSGQMETSAVIVNSMYK